MRRKKLIHPSVSVDSFYAPGIFDREYQLFVEGVPRSDWDELIDKISNICGVCNVISVGDSISYRYHLFFDLSIIRFYINKYVQEYKDNAFGSTRSHSQTK